MSRPGWPGVVTGQDRLGERHARTSLINDSTKDAGPAGKVPSGAGRTHAHTHSHTRTYEGIWQEGIEGNIIKKLKSLYVFMLADWMVPLLLLHSDSLMCCWWTRLDWTRMRTSTWTWTWTWMVAAEWTNRPGGVPASTLLGQRQSSVMDTCDIIPFVCGMRRREIRREMSEKRQNAD